LIEARRPRRAQGLAVAVLSGFRVNVAATAETPKGVAGKYLWSVSASDKECP
jgi:hypothetical protein